VHNIKIFIQLAMTSKSAFTFKILLDNYSNDNAILCCIIV